MVYWPITSCVTSTHSLCHGHTCTGHTIKDNKHQDEQQKGTFHNLWHEFFDLCKSFNICFYPSSTPSRFSTSIFGYGVLVSFNFGQINLWCRCRTQWFKPWGIPRQKNMCNRHPITFLNLINYALNIDLHGPFGNDFHSYLLDKYIMCSL